MGKTTILPLPNIPIQRNYDKRNRNPYKILDIILQPEKQPVKLSEEETLRLLQKITFDTHRTASKWIIAPWNWGYEQEILDARALYPTLQFVCYMYNWYPPSLFSNFSKQN